MLLQSDPDLLRAVRCGDGLLSAGHSHRRAFRCGKRCGARPQHPCPELRVCGFALPQGDRLPHDRRVVSFHGGGGEDLPGQALFLGGRVVRGDSAVRGAVGRTVLCPCGQKRLYGVDPVLRRAVAGGHHPRPDDGRRRREDTLRRDFSAISEHAAGECHAVETFRCGTAEGCALEHHVRCEAG